MGGAGGLCGEAWLAGAVQGALAEPSLRMQAQHFADHETFAPMLEQSLDWIEGLVV